MTPYFFDRGSLQRRLASARPDYVAAVPFPHCVIDDFVPASVLEQVLVEFPDPRDPGWSQTRSGRDRKMLYRDEDGMGPQTRQLVDQLRSSTFVRFLEALTGIAGLVPGPHLDGGGGLCAIEPGCRLQVHADYNRNEHIRLDRRLNVILFLNKDWREEYGGQLELWDRTVTRCGRRILPAFNRCVVFATSDYTPHGHPTPVQTPDGRTRKALILYYYTNGRPADEATAAHGTIYHARPGEHGARARRILRKCVPPIVHEVLHAVRRRR
jgi:hypothetical protein